MQIDCLIKDKNEEIPRKLENAMVNGKITRYQLKEVSSLLNKLRKDDMFNPNEVTIGNSSAWSVAIEAVRSFNAGLKKCSRPIRLFFIDLGNLV